MDNITCLNASWLSAIYCVILSQEGFMQRSYKMLCQRSLFKQCLLLHHLQTNIAGGHFVNITNFSLANYLSEQE